MRTVILCCVLIPILAAGQVRDDFSDGDFTKNPRWVGDSSRFEINAAGQLHLKSQGSDTSILVTHTDASITGEWRFWMKLSFNTSSNNFARVYLVSDSMNIVPLMNAWYLQAGGGGDSICIYRQEGLSPEKLYGFQSYRTNHSTNTVRFRITSDASGKWEAMMDTTGGTRYYTDGTFSGPASLPAGWFGVFCRYTSSNATKFYFDDFYAGPLIRDTTPPVILSVRAKSDSVIRIAFSEEMDRAEAENTANYLLGPGGLQPWSAAMDPQSPEVTLHFHEKFASGFTGTLKAGNLQDINGNVMKDTVVPVFYYRPAAWDIVINEIMADPSPQVGLPDGEYVELYNRSVYPADLEGWSFEFGSYSKIFPSVVIRPGGFLLIAKDSSFLAYGDCVLLFTSSSSLSNEGTTLVLKDPLHHVIHTVSYSPAWFRGSFKGDGGWSLEMADPANPCGCGDNWGPSADATGGTPGRVNSNRRALSDREPPALLRAAITDSATLMACFTEPMDSTTLIVPGSWTVAGDGGLVHPISVEPVVPGFTAARLHFSSKFERRVVYQLLPSPLFMDCAGNRCDTSRIVRFGFPDTVAPHDVIINEILSNPASGGARFVELFNRSDRIADLQTLMIAGRDPENGLITGGTPLFSSPFIMFPGEYLALTSDAGDIGERYHSPAKNAIVSVPGFPVFGDDTGTVVLARKDNFTVIDRMHYDPSMHYPLLATTAGVSLERTSAEVPSGQNDNWHSAAETAGFATPGYLNSHSLLPESPDDEITVDPPLFSPDNDGRDDLLAITIREKEPDYSVNIEIYDAGGVLVRQLVNNVLPGSEGIFMWDGMTAQNRKAPLGIYVLLIEITRPGGLVKRVKRTAIVGGKF